jgi:hypothetical protein
MGHKYGRGRCPKCLCTHRLAKAGTLHKHGDCPGAGKRPTSVMANGGRGRKPDPGRPQDVAELLSWGVSVDEICRRLDTTPTALARQMYRHGHKDLANVFNRVASRERRAKTKRSRNKTFPIWHPPARTWAIANGYRIDSRGRVRRPVYDAWAASLSDAA